MLRFLLPACLFLSIACGSVAPSDDLPDTQDPLLKPTFHIEPADIFTASNGPHQFRAVDAGGSPVSVFWRIADGQVGQIDQFGLFSPCYGGGYTRVRALLQSDTSKVASTSLTVVQQAFGIVGISALTYAEGTGVVRIDSIAGAVDVAVIIKTGALTCKPVSGSRLELLSVGMTIRVDSVSFTPSPTGDLVYTFRWNAGAIANGSYALRPVLVFATSEVAGPDLHVVVRNP